MVLDTSTLISLAWSGQLGVLTRAPIELVVPDVVRQEAVDSGHAAGYPDAAAIDAAIGGLGTISTQAATTTDQAVLSAGVDVGTLVTNDLALGRRAANLGARWLRTADLILLCMGSGSLSADDGRAALGALHAAGRLTPTLLASYLEAL